MAHSSSLNVEQVPAVRLQRIAQIGKRGAVRQQDLPVGAAPGKSLPFSSGPVNVRGQGHNAPASLRSVAEIEWFSEGGLKAIDGAEARGGKLEGVGRPFTGSFG